jgi:hypothetical protein
MNGSRVSLTHQSPYVVALNQLHQLLLRRMQAGHWTTHFPLARVVYHFRLGVTTVMPKGRPGRVDLFFLHLPFQDVLKREIASLFGPRRIDSQQKLRRKHSHLMQKWGAERFLAGEGTANQ